MYQLIQMNFDLNLRFVMSNGEMARKKKMLLFKKPCPLLLMLNNYRGILC
jgi:hypothetical protein